MSLRLLYTLDDFEYENLKIPIKVYHQTASGSNPLYKFEFKYKGCEVYDWYYHKDYGDAYSWTRIYCEIIDKYGSEGVERFRKCKEKLSEIKDKYIVVDNKVFKFDKIVMDISPHKYHRMEIRMTDNSLIDGDSMMNHDYYIRDKDQYSYGKTLNNLRDKVQCYFENNKILPCEEFLLENITKQYNELLLEYRQMIE